MLSAKRMSNCWAGLTDLPASLALIRNHDEAKTRILAPAFPALSSGSSLASVLNRSKTFNPDPNFDIKTSLQFVDVTNSARH